MPSPKELAKALARQDSVTQPPRNRFLGAIADAAGYVSDQADRYVVPERDPLLGGMRGGDLLPFRNVNRLLDDLSYGGRITTGRGQTTTLRPEVVDTVALGGMLKNPVKLAGIAALKNAAKQIHTGTGVLGSKVMNPRMNMFAGEGAKTADHGALKVAKDMQAAGVPDEQIHAKTKWTFAFADGKPRFEIDDSAAQVIGKRGQYGGFELQSGAYPKSPMELMPHKQLQEAYPDANNIELSQSLLNGVGDAGSRGGYDVGGAMTKHGTTPERISLYDFPGQTTDTAKSTTLHELQHAIQQREGFARGGSPEMFMRGYQNKLKDLNSQVTDINQQMRAVSGTPQYDELMNARSGIVKQIQAIEGRDGLGALEAANKDYRRLAGEAEARLTQSRMNMTPAERAASYPPSMFDVPVKDQIVRYGNNVGGAMMHRPKLQVKPPKEDIYSVADANFSMGIPSGNKTVKIGTLQGSMSSAAGDAERVKKLAGQMSADGGYIERLIVDQNGNVIEGQHRLNALRSLGVTDIPVSVIQDASPTYDLLMKSGKLRSEHARQIVRDSVDMLKSEGGDVSAVLSGYDLPKGYEQYFMDAVNDLSKPKAMSAPDNVGGAMMHRPKTEFEILHDTAQRNAALPVEQGGLGLPSGNTYMDRAGAMGFDTPAYHGTNADIKEFDLSKHGTSTDKGDFGKAVYVSTDNAIANKYANAKDMYGKDISGANVMPLSIKENNTYPVNGQQGMAELIKKLGGEDAWYDLQQNPDKYANAIKDLGYDSVRDYGYKQSAVFNPTNIRSRFAAFDPMRRHEADILAGVGVGGMLDPQAIAEALRQQDRK